VWKPETPHRCMPPKIEGYRQRCGKTLGSVAVDWVYVMSKKEAATLVWQLLELSF